MPLKVFDFNPDKPNAEYEQIIVDLHFSLII